AARREGAELALTYQNERFKDRVHEMAREFGSEIALPCEVTSDAEIGGLFQQLKKSWDGLDGLVHAIAFAPREAIAGDFLAGIGGFGKILKFVEEHSPLRRNVTTEDVGNAAAFLLSDLAAAITGEILHVDAGFSHVVAGIADGGSATSSPD